MKNMKMTAKLLLSFAIVALLTVALGAVSMVVMGRIDTQYTGIIDHYLPGIYELGHINTSIRGERSNMRIMEIYIYRNDAEGFAASLASLNNDSQAIVTAMEEYEKTISPGENRETYDAAAAEYKKFATLRDNYIVIAQNMDADAAFEALQGVSDQQKVVIAAFESLMQTRMAQANTVSDAATELTKVSEVVIVGALLVAFTVAVVLGIYVSRIISKPLGKMQKVLHQVGTTGSMVFSQDTLSEIEAETKYKDEIGASIRAFYTMLRHMLDMSEELGYMAAGDMSRTVESLSDADTMATAMNELIQSVNSMFGDIGQSSLQVSTGAKQIADGAQSLAQGATEQAAAVQELSSSIGEVSGAIQETATSAQNTAALSDDIKKRAEQGSEQMRHMVEAVQDINEASQNIAKIIKVIDDIAFQTNILALNAAVEAARAGEHGRSFTVVAEEVRALAGKSAEAAKNTDGLIESSIAKAEMGVTIAKETNASLQSIVEGINGAAQLVTDIAQNAQAQASAIAQINIGIDQVAQVVQQNSATAQESAAASQEMSSQSAVLQELIGQFRLRQDPELRRLAGRNQDSSIASTQSEQASRTRAHDGGGFGKY